jgi:hypothetical protein
MSTATIQVQPKSEWSFTKAIIMVLVMTFALTTVTGAIADGFAKQHPIRNGIGNIFYQIGNLVRIIPWVAPFFVLDEPPLIEYQAIRADGTTESGELNHEFTEQ